MSPGNAEYIWLPTESGQAQLIGLYKEGRFYAVHTDHLDTPRLITNDANQVVWQWAYSAFGDNPPSGILQATQNPDSSATPAVLLQATAPQLTMNLRMAGQYFDEESGLFENGFRSYRPGMGAYSQFDPIGLAGGLNRTGYVGGDPLRKIDPRGLDNPGMGPYGPYWTGVLRCKRPINISWVGRASTVLPNHNWILTGTAEAGMGARCPVPGQGCSDVPGAQTQTLDHTGQSQTSDASCEIVPDIDEQCVSDAIRPGQSTGRWMPWNQCQSFADDVLEKCSTKKQVPFSPRNGNTWR